MDDALIPQRQHRDKHVTTPILFFLYSVYYAERGTQKKKKKKLKEITTFDFPTNSSSRRLCIHIDDNWLLGCC
jgi:hypothetical protein